MKVRLLGGVDGRSSNVSPEKCINLFYEKDGSGESLISTPGDNVFAALTGGEVRGGIAYNNLAYFVCGSTLYELDAAGTATSRGTLNTSSGRVSMAHNGVRSGANQQIMIVDGTDGWIYDNTTSTLSEITDVDFTNSVSVVFIDGYFIFAQLDSDRFWLTSQYDGTAIDSSDFSTAEGAPDKIQALVADQRELFIFGEETLEVWYNSGDADNTFQRFQGGFKQTGCAAKNSPARIDNNIYWLSKNERGHGQVTKLGQGYQPEIISTPALDKKIQGYSNISDAFGYAYQYEGHEFYVLTFPTAKVTWVYDASTQQWHRRGHTIDDEISRERYNCHVFAFGKHLFGDYGNGNVYEMDSDSYTSNSTRVERVFVTPNMSEEETRIRVSAIQLDMEEGVSAADTDDSSIWMSWSKDGGHTWSNEVEKSIGDLGDYARRLVWRRLGQGRNWTFRFRTWSPSKLVFKALYIRPYGVDPDGG